MRRRTGGGAKSSGFTLLVVLVLLGVLSAGASLVAVRLSDELARDKEQQLLRVGDLYARALVSYWHASPGTVSRFPAELTQLLEDPRYLGMRRHLRVLYPDPTTGRVDWILIRDENGGIKGLRSRSQAATWLKVARQLSAVDLLPAQRQSDWVFMPRAALLEE